MKTPKLFKLRKSKSEKLAKSKKPSKIENSPNFCTKKVKPSFLTFSVRIIFNCL